MAIEFISVRCVRGCIGKNLDVLGIRCLIKKGKGARPGGMPEGLGSPFLYKNQYMKDYVLIDEKMGVQ